MSLVLRTSELPDWREAGLLCLDLETCDPNLIAHGPGDVRGDGFIAGVGLAADDEEPVYVPLAHEQGDNAEREPVTRWLRDQLEHRERRERPVTGANLNYDRGWLYADLGIDTLGVPNHDVQIAEPLIDETQSSYSLGAIAERRGYGGKDEEELYAWLAATFGGRATRKRQGGRIWRAPAEVVHDYVMSDLKLPIAILREQYEELERKRLWDAFEREVVVSDIVLAMRRRGVRVDAEHASREVEHLQREIDDTVRELGLESLWSPEDVAGLCRHHGLEPPRTPKSGQPSVTKSYLEGLEAEGHGFATRVLRARKLDHNVGTFIRGYILGNVAPDGRVHGQFHQLRGDDEDRGMQGTITARFSSSLPNLQNLPSRDPEMGPLCRGMFLPDEGEEWLSDDYAQIEPRLTLHYARGPQAERMREAYRGDPSIDCYDTLIEELSGEGLGRKPVKNIWLGLLYSMGLNKLCLDLGVDDERGKELIGIFDEAAPYVKRLKKDVENAAKRRGWIRTLGGRLMHFPFWEPADFQLKFARDEAGERLFPPTRDRQEMSRWLREAGYPPRTTRAYAHKALNKLIQPGAADVMKDSMVDLWRSGVCDVLGAPLVTVHDELGWSKPRTREGDEAAAEVRHRMENPPSFELALPLRVDEERGPDWGHLEEAA